MADRPDKPRADGTHRGDDLQESIDRLRAMANALDDLPTDGLSVVEMQAVSQRQARLRALAGALVSRQIDLLAGEAKVSAAEINAAVRYAQEVIAQVADVRVKLGKVQGLIEFVGVVLTGDGLAMVGAALDLKARLG